MEEDEPGAKRSRLADEWSESESDDDSNDDGGDDLVSTSDNDGQKPSLDISLEDCDRALSRGYGCKDGSHSNVLPAPAHSFYSVPNIQSVIAQNNTYLLGLLRAGYCRMRALLVCLCGEDLLLTTPSIVCQTVFVEGCGS